jgi:hypothetical protein
MLTNNNVSLLRAAYERAAARFPNFITQRQELRVELPLKSNQNQYTFQIKQGNTSTDGPNSVLLNDQDAFVLVATQIYVLKQNPTTTPVQYNNAQRFTYPDPQVFVGAPAGQALEYEALWAIWNGNMSFNTSSLQRMKPIDLYSHLYAPQAQVVPSDGGTLLTITNNTLAEFNGPANDAWVEYQPTILLDGSQNNSFIVTLGSGDITAIDGSYAADGDQDAETRNYLGLRLLGLLISEGSMQAKQFEKSWI